MHNTCKERKKERKKHLWRVGVCTNKCSG